MKQKEFLNTIIPCKNTLYRLAKRLLVSSDEAEDAVQEVFLKLWKGRDKIDNYRSPEAFAITMTKNYCLDRLKSKQASNLKIVHNNYKNSENIERTIEGNEGVELVTKIMETLPEKQKEVFLLSRIEKKKYKEIAEIVGISVKAVEKRMHLALLKMKDKIGDV